MWGDGIFGNPVDPQGTVFDNRAHAATAKAVMINTAFRYGFTGPGDDHDRVRQGWGMPSIRSVYEARDRMLVVDETDPLAPFGVATYPVEVPDGLFALRATLVYTDPMGVPNSVVHRVNDLTLRMTAPDRTVYWGNHGLTAGNWSTPGGSPDVLNTVENVFVRSAAPGTWTVEVLADEINQDGRPETPELDADFALVVTTVSLCRGDVNADGSADAADLSVLIGSFGSAVPPGTSGDVNGDGIVDTVDLSVLISGFGCGSE